MTTTFKAYFKGVELERTSKTKVYTHVAVAYGTDETVTVLGWSQNEVNAEKTARKYAGWEQFAEVTVVAVGNEPEVVEEVPTFQATVTITFADGKTTVEVAEIRTTLAQAETDLNTLYKRHYRANRKNGVAATYSRKIVTA